ncbi:MAG: hypothetical protein KGL39_28430 [Patescibacteria group bacterium]|nr:hypothetical protein [Patescibacteria group bacterium]
MTLTNEQKEELRHAALQAAAIRFPAALTARQITRAVKKELPFLFEEMDVEAALELLQGFRPALIEFGQDEMGATKYWRATSEGVLKMERG